MIDGDLPDHGHLLGGLEGKRGEQNGVVGELGWEEFWVEKLLTFGQDGGELADAAFQLAHRVVAAHSNGVLLSAPLHRQRYLLFWRRWR